MDTEKLLRALDQLREIQDKHAARHAEIWGNYHPRKTTADEFERMQKASSAEWFREKNAGEIESILSSLTRQEKEVALLMRLPPGSEITLQIPDKWLDRLLQFHAAVLLEAQRLKDRMSDMPFHAKRAALEGDSYWLRLAGSYQGSK